ncbi:MAG TPA: hypothetical protein VJN18_11185 [Polyangiaceae bacterium]|nr:hypothetical protein [Polyangiaceae bacterium]
MLNAAIRFERVEHACCSLCNAPSLADFERSCVLVKVSGDITRAGFFCCFDCIDLLVRARGGTPTVQQIEPEVCRLILDLMNRPAAAASHGCPKCGALSTAKLVINPDMMGLRCSACGYFLRALPDGTLRVDPVEPDA